MVITARKAARLRTHERRQKRGGGALLDEAALGEEAGFHGAPDLEQVVGREPSPEFAAQVADECRRLLDRLKQPELKALALLKMEGHDNEEAAALLGCALRTVERKLRLIRALWEQEDEKSK